MASTRRAAKGLAGLARRLPREADTVRRGPASETRPAPAADRLEQVAVRLPAELVERLRRAAFHTPGETLTGIVERGARAELERMGGDFPPIPAGRHVKRGRPIGR